MVVFGAGGARADYGPSTYNSATSAGDVVCVGSDTVQVIGDFVADGNESGTGQGYNTTSNGKFKFISLDATADANVRVAYSVTSSADAGPTGFHNLSPTVVLRAGQFPAQRPNGSGAGINALLNDVTESVNSAGTVTSTYSEKVNCVRMSSIPSLAQFNSAAGQGWGGLHLIRAADDNLQVASLPTSTSNVPATLSRAQLIAIYANPGIATWSALPGGYTPPNPSAAVGTTGNCPSCSPLPLLPQSGSGTRNQFLQDLCVGSSNPGCSGTPPTVQATAITTTVNQSVEENDPTALTNATDPADALAPFSGDRLALWSSGAFHNPFTAVKNSTASVPAGPGVTFPPVGDPAYPGGATLSPGVVLGGTGTASDGNSGYLDTRGLWFVYRAVDDGDPAWQPGSSKNWAQTLLSTGSFLGTSFRSSADVNAASGNKYDFVDCGTNQSTWATTTGCFNSVQ